MYLAGKPRRTGKYRLEADGDISLAGVREREAGWLPGVTEGRDPNKAEP